MSSIRYNKEALIEGLKEELQNIAYKIARKLSDEYTKKFQHEMMEEINKRLLNITFDQDYNIIVEINLKGE